MIRHLSSILIGILVTSPLLSAPLLNPLGIKAGERFQSQGWASVTEPAQSEWLTSTLKNIQIFNSGASRHSLYDSQSENLDSKIKFANRKYLELNYQETSAGIRDAGKLIMSSLPYSSLRTDIIELAALEQMMAEDAGDYEPFFDPRSFASDFDYLEKLPEGIRERIRSSSPEVVQLPISSLNFGNNARIILNGREVQSPLKVISNSRYLLQAFNQMSVMAGWLTTENGKPEFKELWRKNIWITLPETTLAIALKKSRPKMLKSDSQVGILIGNQEDAEVKAFSMGVSARAISTPPSALPLNPVGFEDFDKKDSSESNSVFKSPWFWVVTGVVLAGVTGLVIHQATQETKVIETP